MRWYLLCILNVFVFVNQRCWFNALRSQAHSSPSLSNISDLHQHYHYHTFLSKHIGQMPDAFVSDLFAMKNIVPILPSQVDKKRQHRQHRQHHICPNIAIIGCSGNIGNFISNMFQYCHHVVQATPRLISSSCNLLSSSSSSEERHSAFCFLCCLFPTAPHQRH